MMKPASRTFQAKLESIDSPLKGVMARIPFDAGKALGKRGHVKVKGEINGFAFRTSLFPRWQRRPQAAGEQANAARRKGRAGNVRSVPA